MAMADLVMPRLPDQQHSFYPPQHHQPFHHHHHHHHHPHQSSHYNPQISPLSTTSSSNNPSPTSPKAYHTRQVRPLYMPAVLRPTQFPSKPQPQSPLPGGDDDEASAADKVLRSSSSFVSLSGLSMLGRLSRRSTGDSGKCVDGNWNLALFPQVSGLPSRSHWKPDSESTVCDDATCKRHFSYFVRRHHCRRCGNIFCDAHSSYEIPLDEKADYNPRGTTSRACAHCYAEFRTWRSRTNSQASSDSASTAQAHRRSPSANTVGGGEAPAAGSKTAAAAASSPISTTPSGSPNAQQQAEVAVSVPSDWNWSTF